MLMVLYLFFSGCLYAWTSRAITYESKVPAEEYAGGAIVLALFLLVFWILDRSKRIRIGMLTAGALIMIGLNVNYVTWGRASHSEERADDLILMLAVYVFVYMVIRYTKIYKYKAVNQMLMAVPPVALLGARIMGDPVKGTYMYFCGIMVFAILFLVYPFVAAHFLSADEDRYLGGDVRRISFNLMSLLGYTFLLYAGLMLINEYGAILILGIVSSILFFSNCRDKLTKLLYTLACGGGALLAAVTADHVKARLQVWLDPLAAYADKNLKEAAESVLFVFRHIRRTGFWGNGIRTLSERYYDTLHNDHVLVLNVYENGLLWVAVILAVFVLLIKWMVECPAGVHAYDKYLNLASALIMASMLLVNLASVTGSFLTAGIPCPFLSDGTSINVMAMALLAIHCGVFMKRKKVEVYA